MDKIELLKELENMGEIEPDKYDGSYELMREIIKSYSGLDNYDKCTYLDINAIYMMSVGTWKFNIQKKKEYIGKGCLPKSEKERLYEILDKVWDNACNKVYENVLDRPSVGMFGAGIFSFVKKITEQCAKDFILMCVDIYKMEDDNEIYDRAEMMPDEEVLMNMGIGNISIDGITLDIVAMLKTINARIEFLYDREHTIGHAFFMELVNEPTIDKLASIFMKSIIPLLQEYFYEDYQKIQLVLGDNAKNNPDLKFIKDDRIDLKSIFMGNVDDIVDEKEVIYTINKPAFWNVDSYKTIGKNL